MTEAFEARLRRQSEELEARLRTSRERLDQRIRSDREDMERRIKESRDQLDRRFKEALGRRNGQGQRSTSKEPPRQSGAGRSDQHAGAAPKPKPDPASWWVVLGVSQSATLAEIKTAYRRIAKVTHPDTAEDKKGDLDRFNKATEAFRKAQKQ